MPSTFTCRRDLNAKKNNFKYVVIIFLLFLVVYMFNLYNYFKMVNNWDKLYDNREILKHITCFSLWDGILKYEFSSMFFMLSPILISLAGISNMFVIKKTGFLTYIVNRTNYKKFLFSEIIKSWSTAGLILPVLVIIIYVLSVIIIPNTVLSSDELTNGMPFITVPELMLSMSAYVYIIALALTSFLYSVFVINIGMILIRFFDNIIVILLGNFIIFIILETIGVTILGPFLASILNNSSLSTYFSIYNLWYLDSIPSIIIPVIYGIMLVLTSTLFLGKIYTNKENLLNENY